MIYDIVEIDVADIGTRPNALRDIYERRIDGLIVHNVYTRDEMATVADRLAARDPALPWTEMEWGHTVGRVLVRADLDVYHRIAASFRNGCRDLFRDVGDFEARFTEIAGALSGGRPVEIPHNRDGASYTPATVRCLEPGGDLALHCGNQFLQDLPEFAHLCTVLDPEDQLSYFLTIAEADDGGGLTLYALEWPKRPDTIVRGEPTWAFGPYPNMAIRPPAGSLLFFDGGRIWHRITPVRGRRTRITIGGFAAFSLDDERVCYWS